MSRSVDDDVDEADRVAGTGNSTFPSAELRFIGGDPVTNQFTRAAVTDAVPEAERATGEGTALVPIRAAGANLATVDGTPWDGVITMQWDPEEKLYFCPPFCSRNCTSPTPLEARFAPTLRSSSR